MRVGIITHYYHSKNYGGNLQAYALCRMLDKLGHSAEQISFRRIRGKSYKQRVAEVIKGKTAWRGLFRQKQLNYRKKAILRFNIQAIPHSKVYTEYNIHRCVDDYDVFVVGSDQVWHPSACCDAYLLKFVPEGKRKLAYAASVATDRLSERTKDEYRQALRSFKAISVREESAVKLLEDVVPKPIAVTLDPTLLLDREEWQQVTEENPVKGAYLFCFFLGEGKAERELAVEYAQRHELKIVTLPHLLGKYRKNDAAFGDCMLYDVGPGELLALIRDAECVFTDSFHAAVFSQIFQKQFFIFHRNGAQSMSTRIYSLVDLFGTQSRFCDDDSKMSLEYLESLPAIEYADAWERYEIKKEESISFLREQLNCD